MKKFKISKKKIATLSPDELWDYFKWLRENGAIMYSVFGTLSEMLKPYCFNDGKNWGNDARESVRRFLLDPFNLLVISEVSAKLGRTPFQIYNTFIRMMWNAVYDGKRGLLKRIAKSAVRYGHAEWV